MVFFSIKLISENLSNFHILLRHYGSVIALILKIKQSYNYFSFVNFVTILGDKIKNKVPI